MLTATKILDNLKSLDYDVDIDHVRYVLKQLVASGKVENHNQGGNCNLYSRAALTYVREFIEQSGKGV